jgi:glycosyltransferase involved in cell wall biosynthesis
VRLVVLSRHVPDPDGTAAGRALHALVEGLLAEGHEVSVCSWGPEEPDAPLPPWCVWRRVDPDPGLGGHLRALLRPRADVLRAGWEPEDDAVAVADDPLSFAAVARASRNAVTFHYLTRLDVAALRRIALRDLQDLRAERRAARRARVVLAYSERVAARLPGARAVPIACPVPPEPLPPVEDPVAALLADFRWPPNRASLGRLLACWPEVRARLPAARLLLAGPGLEAVGPGDGVTALGSVRRSVEVLGRAALVAFPAPASSGPKVKVIEALAHGVPVVTTPAGVEGTAAGGGAVVAAPHGFAAALADLLADPARRARLGAAGRAAVAAVHAPIPAARARVAALRAGLGLEAELGLGEG